MTVLRIAEVLPTLSHGDEQTLSLPCDNLIPMQHEAHVAAIADWAIAIPRLTIQHASLMLPSTAFLAKEEVRALLRTFATVAVEGEREVFKEELLLLVWLVSNQLGEDCLKVDSLASSSRLGENRLDFIHHVGRHMGSERFAREMDPERAILGLAGERDIFREASGAGRTDTLDGAVAQREPERCRSL